MDLEFYMNTVNLILKTMKFMLPHLQKQGMYTERKKNLAGLLIILIWIEAHFFI